MHIFSVRDKVIALSVLVLLLGLAYLLLVIPVSGLYEYLEDEVHQVHRDISKLDANIRKEKLIKSQYENKTNTSGSYFIEVSNQAEAAAAIQVRVKSILAKNRMRLVSTDVTGLSPSEVENYNRLSLSMTVSGKYEDVIRSVYMIESGNPIILIDQFVIETVQVSDTGISVKAEISYYGYFLK